MNRWKIISIILVSVLVVLLSTVFFIKRPILALVVDETNLPKFIQADFIDLNRLATISKFRSAEGHDFSGHGENCRSMKHYFSPPRDETDHGYRPGDPPPVAPDPATATPIYSPVDGIIISVSGERTPIGKQIEIRPNTHPSFSIRLFHIYPNKGLGFGSKVKAGQRIGVIGANQGTDIAIQALTLKGDQFVSYFQVMSDQVFANYQKLGFTSRNQFIISRHERDAKPLQCLGNYDEQFAKRYQDDPNYDEVVYLNGQSRPNFR